MYYKIYKEAIRQREALSRASSNTLLNNVHLHRISTSRHHSRTCQQFLLQPNDDFHIKSWCDTPATAAAIELNTDNGEIHLNIKI